MCHCDADLTVEALTAKYDLPLINREMIWPAKYYWENMALAYFQMYNSAMNYENCMGLGGDQLPPLNHMATSYNTEEQHSNEGTKKKRKFSNTLDYDNSEYTERRSKKAKSDVRLKTQERRLKEQNLEYESRETYNQKTKRTSRVLVCLHDGCGKEFKKTRNLIIHSRVHTKIRPHICQYCSKGFTQQCNLKKHIELHLNGTFKNSEVVA
ncbi:unnamed protein product [Moneuplotes crassus]|uniref:C2H2-type domain-containing protein n=1 Tax=Euplotes crassus TaxID=5936 RepID=A0AAD1X944_EUPCR|nr:unnamed protein product [Moneuplotes crassus]